MPYTIFFGDPSNFQVLLTFSFSLSLFTASNIYIFSIGKDSVLEAQAILDGHYLEFARFIFNPVTVGKAFREHGISSIDISPSHNLHIFKSRMVSKSATR